MEEIQSYWEIPAVTHFCHVFRAAFNLIHFEIEELEQAILQEGNDPESYFSIDVLMVRLVQGCLDSEINIRVENWEPHLQKLFNSCGNEACSIYNSQTPFAFLPSYDKINVIFKLCEMRLNAVDVTDTIKDIPAESMQAKLVGKDSKNYFYWYFCGIRLYKESETKKLSSKRKESLLPNSKKNDNKKGSENRKNVQEQKKREVRKQKALKNSEYSWSVACYSLSDWESLAKSLSKSKSPLDKQLAQEIELKYLPMLPNIIAEAERLTRKRLIELAPKRTSSRISKVLALKKLEEQIASEAAEEKRKKMAANDGHIEDEKEKRIREIEERRKRAAERNKAMEERAKRAKQRQERFYESKTETTKVSSNSKTMHYKKGALTPRRKGTKIQRPVLSSSKSSDENSTSDTGNEIYQGQKSNPRCKDSKIQTPVLSSSKSNDENSSSDNENEIYDGQKSNHENTSSNSEDDCSVQSSSENGPELKSSYSVESASDDECKSNVQSFIEKRFSSYCNKKITTQHSQLNTSVKKLHIVNKSPEKSLPAVKIYRPENKFFRCRPYEGYRPPVYKPKNVLQPISLPMKNIRSFNKSTTSPSIIRFDFIKENGNRL